MNVRATDKNSSKKHKTNKQKSTFHSGGTLETSCVLAASVQSCCNNGETSRLENETGDNKHAMLRCEHERCARWEVRGSCPAITSCVCRSDRAYRCVYPPQNVKASNSCRRHCHQLTTTWTGSHTREKPSLLLSRWRGIFSLWSYCTMSSMRFCKSLEVLKR